MRKRITSLLLTLVMLLSLVPAMGVTANAEDGFVEVSTYEDLRNEVDKGSAKIRLVADIDTTNENSGIGVTTATNLSFKGSGNVLDLNGHKLKLVSNMSVYFIEIYSSDLTIKDSGTNGRIDLEYGEAVLGVQRAIVINRSVGVKRAGSLTLTRCCGLSRRMSPRAPPTPRSALTPTAPAHRSSPSSGAPLRSKRV